MILADTSFLIRALVRGTREDAALRGWLRAGTVVGSSTVAWAEFQCGPVEPDELELAATIIAERLPFTDRHAVLAGRLFNRTGRRRGTLIDCMIGAVAIDLATELATANPADFRRMEPLGLSIAAY
jgi:predicted nucleic acid-binding protein